MSLLESQPGRNTPPQANSRRAEASVDEMWIAMNGVKFALAVHSSLRTYQMVTCSMVAAVPTVCFFCAGFVEGGPVSLWLFAQRQEVNIECWWSATSAGYNELLITWREA